MSNPYGRHNVYRDGDPTPPRATPLALLLTAVSTLAWMFAGVLLVGTHFLPETRILLGGIYLLIGTNAAIGAAVLWRLSR
jgi:hypothetical protein